MDIHKEKLIEMYRKLLLARKIDDKLYQLNSTGAFTGWLHLGAGQEAMSVALGAVMRKDDWYKPDFRGNHGQVGKGIPTRLIFATMMNKQVPEGSETYQDYGINTGGTTLGETEPILTGTALGSKLQGLDRVTVNVFGDGTANKGPVHEAMNMAAIWKLPIVYVCINNQYAISMPFNKSCACADIADRADGYGMPGVVVDGNDVIACYEVASDAIKRAREGGGPSLIEAKTYRLRGHWEGDQEVYRSEEEVKEAWKKEPVGRYRENLLKMGIFTNNDIEKMDAETTAEIEDAVAWASNLPTLAGGGMH